MRTYRIRDGFTVRLDEGQLLQGGAVVEMDDATADRHAHKLEPAEPATEQAPANETAEEEVPAAPERKRK